MAKTKSKSKKRKYVRKRSRTTSELKSKGLSNMSISSLRSKGLSSMSISSGMTVSSKPVNYFKIPYFPICEKNLKEFLRLGAHPTDYLINCLEIINAIDSQSAGIMRIIIEPNITGITGKIIEDIFSFLEPTNTWNFKEYNNYIDFEKSIVNTTFPYEHVIFCGITFNNGLNHTFLIGRDISGDYWIIDGQMQNIMCNLTSDIDCYRSLQTAQKWYILEYM